MTRLTIGSLVRSSLATYREDFWRIAALAVAVFVPLSLLQTFIEWAADAYDELEEDPVRIAVLAITFAGTGAAIFGITFFAGALDRLVGARRFGHEHVPLRRVLRTLPYGTLVLANLVVLVVVEVGFLLLVVPGAIAMTLLAIVGPVVNIESCGVRDALRRSVHLVRPRFWLAFFAVTLPVMAEEGIEHTLTARVWDESLLAGFLVNTAFALAVGATVGLLEVTLAHTLIARERSPAPTPARAGAAPEPRSLNATTMSLMPRMRQNTPTIVTSRITERSSSPAAQAPSPSITIPCASPSHQPSTCLFSRELTMSRMPATSRNQPITSASTRSVSPG